MIYSSYRPDTGVWDWYDVPSERRGIGDDLPRPLVTPRHPIGAASTSLGREPPPGRRVHRGSGYRAIGMVMPLDRRGLSGLGAVSDWLPSTGWLLPALVGTALGWWLHGTYAVTRKRR